MQCKTGDGRTAQPETSAADSCIASAPVHHVGRLEAPTCIYTLGFLLDLQFFKPQVAFESCRKQPRSDQNWTYKLFARPWNADKFCDCMSFEICAFAFLFFPRTCLIATKKYTHTGTIIIAKLACQTFLHVVYMLFAKIPCQTFLHVVCMLFAEIACQTFFGC